MAKYCSGCGAGLNVAARFCSDCGTAAGASSQAPAVSVQSALHSLIESLPFKLGGGANDRTKKTIIVLAISAVAFLWGYWYVDSHKLTGLAAAFGATDFLYTLAQWAMMLGGIVFLVGVGVLIGGWQGKRRGPARSKFVGLSLNQSPDTETTDDEAARG